MKKFKTIFGSILIFSGFIGMIACGIATTVFMFQNPDMTAMRRFLEYPEPVIWCIVDYIGIHVGAWMVKY